MAITLKDTKPAMFTTTLEVVSLASLIKTEKLNFDINDDQSFSSPIIIRNAEVESYIIKADGIITSMLKAAYNAPTGLVVDTWSTPPRNDINNNNNDGLLGIELLITSGSTAYWTVTFTSGTTYSLTSSLEGSQGSGTIGTDLTSTNGEVKIGSNSFEAASYTTADKFYFSVINCYATVNSISSMLAASLILSEKYSEAVPNSNKYAEWLWDKAYKLLERLADPNDSMSLVAEAESIVETVSIDYKIDTLGEDDSSYLTENTLDV